MHLIVARRDLTGFQHLHPEQARGRHLDVRAAARRRRLLPRSSPTSPTRTRTTRSPPTCASTAPPTCSRCPPRPPTAVSDGGYDVAPRRRRRPARRGGRAALHDHQGRPAASSTEPYLGAGGHLVALREGDLAFLHVHPTDDGDAVGFAADVPDRAALPAVPAVPARGPRPDRRVHAGGEVAMADHDDTTAHVELPITGMTCASCANRIERKLNKLEGVTASVNYATEKATVEYDAGRRRARAAARRGRGRRLPGHAARRTSRAGRRREPSRRARAAAHADARLAAARARPRSSSR